MHYLPADGWFAATLATNITIEMSMVLLKGNLLVFLFMSARLALF